MKVERVITGSLQENCYIISKNDKCLIVDPGDDFNKIVDAVGNKEVICILITHNHFDHIGCLKDIREKYNCDTYNYKKCLEREYIEGPFKFEVIFNPGHSTDSISFYFKEENIMFVGDFVFKETIGRCDLEGGNYSEMQESIEKIKQYQENIILYPGHGDKTNLENEKKNNPYF